MLVNPFQDTAGLLMAYAILIEGLKAPEAEVKGAYALKTQVPEGLLRVASDLEEQIVQSIITHISGKADPFVFIFDSEKMDLDTAIVKAETLAKQVGMNPKTDLCVAGFTSGPLLTSLLNTQEMVQSQMGEQTLSIQASTLKSIALGVYGLVCGYLTAAATTAEDFDIKVEALKSLAANLGGPSTFNNGIIGRLITEGYVENVEASVEA